MKQQYQFWVIFWLTIIYFLLKYIIPYGDIIIYPVSLFVTFLHEFGHAVWALITWGSVVEVQINSDGSWLATTKGWWRIIILLWWYVGSAIFGNILLYIWCREDQRRLLKKRSITSESTLYVIAGIILLVGIFWFSSLLSLLILIWLSWVLVFLAYKTNYDWLVLQFLGIMSLLYIIEDFNVGPSSDLSKFSEIFVIIPQSIWMILWLILVLMVTFFNIRRIYFSSKG